MFLSKPKGYPTLQLLLSYGRNYVFAIFLVYASIFLNVNLLYSDKFENLFSRWEKISSGTEDSINVTNSTDLLELLRSQLLIESDKANNLSSEQERIVSDILSQLSVLSPELSNQDGNSTLAEKRLKLQNQLASEQEILARINSFSNEFSLKVDKIDRIIRDRFVERLFSLGPSPLGISNWASFSSDISRFFSSLVMESQVKMGSFTLNQAAEFSLNALFWFLVGFSILFWLYPACRRKIKDLMQIKSNNYKVKLFVASNNLLQLILPLAGLVCIMYALNVLPIFDFHGKLLLELAPFVLLFLVAARWLGLSLFSNSVRAGQLLELDDSKANWSARAVFLVGVAIAFDFLFKTMLSNNLLSEPGYSVATFLVVTFLSVVIFQTSRFISASQAKSSVMGNKNVILKLLINLSTYVSLIAPFLTIFGFFEAGRYLVISLSISYFLIGTSYVLFDLFMNIYRAVLLFSKPDISYESLEDSSITPVIVASMIALVNLPIIFLIWGGRVAELRLFWDRLNEGYSLGAAQINLPGFISLIVFFSFGYLITKFLQGVLRDSVLPKTRLEAGGQKAIVSGFGYIGNILAALIAISLIGLDLSSLAIIAGALSVGLGFGMQTVVSNFVSGIILLVERPIQEGDWIEVSGYSGTVKKISVRATHLETLDKAIVVVPNSAIITGTVLNWMHGDKNGRISVPIEVAYGSNPDRIKRLLLDIAGKHPQVLGDPKPTVVFRGFGESALKFELRAYIDTKFGLYVKSDINFDIAKVFQKNKIEIPFPQRDINIRYPGGAIEK